MLPPTRNCRMLLPLPLPAAQVTAALSLACCSAGLAGSACCWSGYTALSYLQFWGPAQTPLCVAVTARAGKQHLQSDLPGIVSAGA